MVVLSGGPGSEREVSINSGKNIVSALRVAENGKRYLVTSIVFREPKDLFAKLKRANVDVVFPVVHGTFGEDGTLQALLEVAGIPYVGSQVLASALCMDKVHSSALLAALKLATPKYFDLKMPDYPCVVKPRASGSSVGVSIVRAKSELAKALRLAKREGEPIIQQYIKGTELTCAVLELKSGEPKAMPVTEIIPKKANGSNFFDYRAKYTEGGSQEITPARISPALTKQVQAAALLAHKMLGCRHISRSDFIFGKGKLYYLETNTAPGMTNTSLVPQAAAVAGYSMPALAHSLVQAALT